MNEKGLNAIYNQKEGAKQAFTHTTLLILVGLAFLFGVFSAVSFSMVLDLYK